jgi:hypothetical protein
VRGELLRGLASSPAGATDNDTSLFALSELFNVSWVEVIEWMKNRPLNMNLLELSGCSNVKEECARLLPAHGVRGDLSK